MVSEGDYVAVFQSIHRVMKAEKLLKGEKLAVLLIPAPRALTSDCGLALRFAAADLESVEKVLIESSLAPYDLYVKQAEEYKALK